MQLVAPEIDTLYLHLFWWSDECSDSSRTIAVPILECT